MRKIITSGCFNLIHPAHLWFLEQAAKLGDELHVFVDVDERNKTLKGDKAIFSCAERCKIIGALKVVTNTYGYSGPNESFEQIIRRLSCELWRTPQHQIIFAKGGDYSFDDLDKSQIDIIRKYEGIVVLLDYDPQYSTTKIFDKIRE